MCKITIIIPVYNSSESIVPCLKSVIDQTYKNYCVIIVNDGSTDNTVGIINDFFIKNGNVDYKIITQENNGPSKARNIGAIASETELIAFLDSDDIWENAHLQNLIDFYQKNNCDLVCTTKSLKNSKILSLTLNNMLWHCYIQSSTMLLRRNIFVECGGFNENKKYSEDYQLWLEICARQYKVYFLPIKDVKTYNDKAIYGASGLSANLWAMEKGELDNYRMIRKDHHINICLYILVCTFSLIKYFFRLLVTKKIVKHRKY